MAIEIQQAPVERKTRDFRKLSWTLGKVKVGTADRIFFTEQLQLLLETGVNLHAALSALSEQAENETMKELLGELCAMVAAGRSFSESLREHPDLFSESYVSLVTAAEQGGFLPQVLKQLQEMDEKREELRSTLVSALTYPAFLAFFSVAVVVFILVVVFPKFGKMFISIRDQLPPTTIALMWLSDMLRNNWPFVLAILSAGFLAIRKLLSSNAARARIDLLKLTVPGIKDLFMPVYLIQILRTLGTSLQNGVAVVDSLRGCRGVVDNRQIHRFLEQTEVRVREGSNFASAFSEAQFLPPLVRCMISTGDQTGNLGAVMVRIAMYYEREVARRLDRFSKIAEPVMLLVMGVIVGVLVSSLILPIFKLTRAVG